MQMVSEVIWHCHITIIKSVFALLIQNTHHYTLKF